jgi:hypothetical protein
MAKAMLQYLIKELLVVGSNGVDDKIRGYFFDPGCLQLNLPI